MKRATILGVVLGGLMLGASAAAQEPVSKHNLTLAECREWYAASSPALAKALNAKPDVTTRWISARLKDGQEYRASAVFMHCGVLAYQVQDFRGASDLFALALAATEVDYRHLAAYMAEYDARVQQWIPVLQAWLDAGGTQPVQQRLPRWQQFLLDFSGGLQRYEALNPTVTCDVIAYGPTVGLTGQITCH